MATPSLETMTDPKDAIDLAKIANDEMAELVMKYPDRFIAAISCLPWNDIDATLDEIDRSINDLRFRGIHICSDINGMAIDAPELMPVYEKMVEYDLPIFIHPQRAATKPDYKDEDMSKYGIWTKIGWPHETSKAMIRLSGSGILEKFPTIKFVTHHAGGTIPFLDHRIRGGEEFNEMRMGYRYKAKLTKKLTDYLRMFYNDTAVYGNTPALMCTYAFCGGEKMIFATDLPFDSQGGLRYLRDTIKSVNDMTITEEERERIFLENARKLMRLPI
jgi:predicted TIM-barrel fold metal-dependent hydrolase